jgi:hypothetical protein
MIEKQNDLKEVIVHLRTPTGAPPTGPRDLSGKAATAGEMNLTIPPENTPVPMGQDGEKGCESCYCTTATRWVSWGPAHEHSRLCGHCYIYWRKFGGLKLPTKWETVEQDAAAQAGDLITVPIEKKPLKERQDKGIKKSLKTKDDLVPHLPFSMSPTAIILYMRKQIGRKALLKAARAINYQIVPQSINKPTDQELTEIIAKHKKGQRIQKDNTLDRVRQALSSPPRQLRLHNSPIPISPSYRAKQSPRLKSVSTAGTYIPPKGNSPSPGPLEPTSNNQTSSDVYQPIQKKREAVDPNEDAPALKLVKKSSSEYPSEVFFQANKHIRSPTTQSSDYQWENTN